MLNDLDVPSSEEKCPIFLGASLGEGLEVREGAGKVKDAGSTADCAGNLRVRLSLPKGEVERADLEPALEVPLSESDAKTGPSTRPSISALDLLSRRLEGVKVEATGDNLDPSVELRGVVPKNGAEMKGS